MELKDVDTDIIINICGSFRRGMADSGDIDLLLTHPQLNDKEKCADMLTKIVNALHHKNILVDDIAHGPTKYMGICQYTNADVNVNVNVNAHDDYNTTGIPATFKIDVPSFDDSDTYHENENEKENEKENNKEKENNNNMTYYHRMDLTYIEYSNYYAGLLYFTGSDSFNRHMRVKANEKGLILNEMGVFQMLDEKDKTKKGNRVVIPKCEKDIFDALGMEYVPPENRSW